MHILTIHKLGPIEECKIQCSHFMTLTGFQASGKSTIAKAIYYFRTIKEDIAVLAEKQALHNSPIDGSVDESAVEHASSLKRDLENHLREKFLRTFGSSWGMSNEMYLEYSFTETCSIRISLVENTSYGTSNYIWITFSDTLLRFLQEKDSCLSVTPLGIPEGDMTKLRADLDLQFGDSCSVVYIPAGRSMITLLSQQLVYIYATMDDLQKRSLDSCTKDYLERILRLKPEFSDGLEGLVAYSAGKTSLPKETVDLALNLIKKILRGRYRYSNGEEQIVLDNGKYVKINFSSSGQQESVWILNLLFYYLLQQRQILFIIEEPESHLFPESQKYMTELIALMSNCGHSIVLTTHSPYVLGTLNNLLYANTVPLRHAKKADEIIPMPLWLTDREFDSWFVKHGVAENCMDTDIHMIQNERIDEISKKINQDFDELLELQDEEDGGII